MLLNIKTLYGHQLAASDGDIGHVKDFYFDDVTWVVRYLVAETGNWLSGRPVLLSPHAFGLIEEDRKRMLVSLSREQIENSPPIESHQPVSREYEADYHRYYRWPAYWADGALSESTDTPAGVPTSRDALDAPQPQPHPHRGDRHLNSTHAVNGYAIRARDGILGHVTGFVVDDRSWVIHGLVVEAGHWYAGKEILIPTSKVTRISTLESLVFVDLPKADIEATAKLTVAHSSEDRDGDYDAVPGRPAEPMEARS